VTTIGVLLVSVALLGLGACSNLSPPPQVGIVADSGFRPGPHGFTFQNYGQVAGGDTAELQFGNWTSPSHGIPLVTTHNGQQTTQTLTNQ
jgi:hypothetical protein